MGGNDDFARIEAYVQGFEDDDDLPPLVEPSDDDAHPPLDPRTDATSSSYHSVAPKKTTNSAMRRLRLAGSASDACASTLVYSLSNFQR